MKICLRFLGAGLLILSTLGIAWSCPPLIEVDCGGGSAWFGLRHDNANVAHGQTYLLECSSRVLSIEVQIINSGQPNGGVPPMVAGDPIFCAIADAGLAILGTSEASIPWDVGEGWVSFDFEALDLELEAGSYYWLLYTDVPRQASVVFCPGADSYPDGGRYASLDGINGPWSPNDGVIDDPFRAHLLPLVTPVQNSIWGNVKALYR